jgi:hypothetical protein
MRDSRIIAGREMEFLYGLNHLMNALPFKVIAALLAATLVGLRADAQVFVVDAPAFTYTYAPRAARALDTNAVNVGVSYNREPPSFFNCSYISPTASAPSTGSITYTFQAAPGRVIQHLGILQRGVLFTSGRITGEFSTNNGVTFQAFFDTPLFVNPATSVTRYTNLRGLNAPTALIRYTLNLTNGHTYNIQFCRDCDDAPLTLTFNGTTVPQTLPSRTTVLVPAGSTWKYRDNGQNLDTVWRLPSFDDRGWSVGAAELGYGDDDEATEIYPGPDLNNKFVTTYFRRAFVVTNAAQFTNLTVGFLRDDGGVIYLNGKEAIRSHMQDGIIGNGTLAMQPPVFGIDESTFFEGQIDPALLLEGTNTLAVEIHQATVDSSDVSFDLELLGQRKRLVPLLAIARAGDCITLSWSDSLTVLEEAGDVSGPWQQTAGGAPGFYSTCEQQERKFYRLRQLP